MSEYKIGDLVLCPTDYASSKFEAGILIEIIPNYRKSYETSYKGNGYVIEWSNQDRLTFVEKDMKIFRDIYLEQRKRLCEVQNSK